MVLKAESERKEKEGRVRLPDPPKTAQDIWQQSVIGDYLARFKVGKTDSSNILQLQTNSLESCDLVPCRMTVQKRKKPWKQPGARWRKKRR